MDNITHTLLGVTLARAGLNRVTPHATLLLVLASNLPDIDILTLSVGQLADFKFHGGYTHTLLALPILALICAGLAALIGDSKQYFLRAWCVACIGVGGHLAADWAGSYGIRALLPFSSKWYCLDLNGFYDGAILTALFLAVLMPKFVGLVAGEIGTGKKHSGQGIAVAMLLFLIGFEGARWSFHERVLNDLSSRLYDGEVPLRVSALPNGNSLLKWTGVIETQDAYRLVPSEVLNFSNATDARIFYKPRLTRSALAALGTEPFRYMQYFARFPVWGFENVTSRSGAGLRVDLTDLRYGVPGGGWFHSIAVVDAAGNVLTSGFSFDTGSLLDKP